VIAGALLLIAAQAETQDIVIRSAALTGLQPGRDLLGEAECRATVYRSNPITAHLAPDACDRLHTHDQVNLRIALGDPFGPHVVDVGVDGVHWLNRDGPDTRRSLAFWAFFAGCAALGAGLLLRRRVA
jgi:hypothetical protein